MTFRLWISGIIGLIFTLGAGSVAGSLAALFVYGILAGIASLFRYASAGSRRLSSEL